MKRLETFALCLFAVACALCYMAAVNSYYFHP